MRRSVKIDAIDRRILAELQKDAGIPMPMLAERVGLSTPASYRRVRRLRETGVIEKEVALVSPRTLGWPLSMITLVILDHEDARTAEDIRKTLMSEPAVVEAWHITGEYDFAVRIIARDMEDYDELAQRIFVENARVRSFKTLVVLRHTKVPGPIPAADDVP